MSLVFFDTSVLIAALDAHHPHHVPCFSLLKKAKRDKGFCAAHTYAEIYSVMSSKPGKPRLRPSDVNAMIGRLDQVLTPVVLSRREYRRVIHDVSAAGFSGGRIYDALILACAVKSGATDIYTLNEKDFYALAATDDIRNCIRRP